MLEHLLNYCQQYGLEPEPGFKSKFVKWAIICKPGGGYLGVSRLGDTQLKNKNPGLEFKKAPDLTQPQMIGLKNCRHFLTDALSVVTLLGKEEPAKKDLAKHEFFKDLLKQASSQVPALSGLSEMLAEPGNLERINQQLTEQGAKLTDSVTFLLDNGYPLDGSQWHEWWGRWWRENAPLKLGKESMLDFLSGEQGLPLLSHFKIMGLGGVGGQSSGDSLVSFNKDAFQSYGLDSSANAAFTPDSARLYSEAFNHLIRHNSRTVSGVKLVHWFKDRLEQADDDLMPDIFSGFDEQDRDEAQSRVRAMIDGIHTGQRSDLAGNRYYAMTISGAAGRVMLRDWMEGSFEELALSIDAWFDELAIVRKDGKGLDRLPGLSSLLAATVRTLDDVTPPQVVELYHCSLHRQRPFPRWALAKTLLRSRADVLAGESPRYNRMALLKAWLQRNSNSKGGEQLSPYLNEDHPQPAYQCGRLMAVYAALQKSALGDVGAGVVQRYYAAASVTPALILGRLSRLSTFHLNKLSGGLTYWYENLLASVWDRIDHEVPASLDLEEQSLFALGYYQQLADMRRPKDKKTHQATDAQAGHKE